MRLKEQQLRAWLLEEQWRTQVSEAEVHHALCLSLWIIPPKPGVWLETLTREAKHNLLIIVLCWFSLSHAAATLITLFFFLLFTSCCPSCSGRWRLRAWQSRMAVRGGRTPPQKGQNSLFQSNFQLCPMGSEVDLPWKALAFWAASTPSPRVPALMANSPFSKDGSALLKEGKQEVASKSIGKGEVFGGRGYFFVLGLFIFFSRTKQLNQKENKKKRKETQPKIQTNPESFTYSMLTHCRSFVVTSLFTSDFLIFASKEVLSKPWLISEWLAGVSLV